MESGGIAGDEAIREGHAPWQRIMQSEAPRYLYGKISSAAASIIGIRLWAEAGDAEQTGSISADRIQLPLMPEAQCR
jgi:hypothetical protein